MQNEDDLTIETKLDLVAIELKVIADELDQIEKDWREYLERIQTRPN